MLFSSSSMLPDFILHNHSFWWLTQTYRFPSLLSPTIILSPEKNPENTSQKGPKPIFFSKFLWKLLEEQWGCQNYKNKNKIISLKEKEHFLFIFVKYHGPVLSSICFVYIHHHCCLIFDLTIFIYLMVLIFTYICNSFFF